MKRSISNPRALILGLACLVCLAGAARGGELDAGREERVLLSLGLRQSFPRLKSHYTVLGPSTKQYNCIAWSIGNKDAWVWPGERVSDFDLLYEKHGYSRQAGLNLTVEPGKQKVVIYATLNPDATIHAVTHAAVQEKDGNWTSKLGGLPLIRHATLEVLRGPSYGTPVAVYVRPAP